jgi:5-methylcytosine-specific restriction endonuclease McrA
VKAWRKQHPDRYREQVRRLTTPERNRASYLAMVERLGRDEVRRRARETYRRNPSRKILHVARRRAVELGRDDGTLTPAAWESIVAEWGGRCAYCDVVPDKLQVEHKIPLSRGGWHTVGNVVPACGPCNLEKRARTDAEYRTWLSIQ